MYSDFQYALSVYFLCLCKSENGEQEWEAEATENDSWLRVKTLSPQGWNGLSRLSGAALSAFSSFISRRAAGLHGANDETWFTLTSELIQVVAVFFDNVIECCSQNCYYTN